MNDFRSRLIDESRELKERLTKLRTFINSGQIRNLDKQDQELLISQEDVMTQYDDIIETRLARI